MKVYGMLTVEELQKQVDTGDIDTVIVVFTDLYGRFMGKRFDAEFFSGRCSQKRDSCL